ncbi:MAG: spherulation-specific family 4 protein [Planctomycetota bacterium]|nr:spherulation-specific family 4 protein [Planctomycetota bacterium]
MMARRTVWWLTLLCVAFASTDLPGQESEPPGDSHAKLTLLVPAYSYPARNGLRFWDELIAAADRVPIVAIANPASGPGTKRDENYTKVLHRAKRAGIRLIGYVTTDYAKRKIAEVNSDIDRWTTLYPMIEGIFFDEQSSDRQHVEYYAALSEHVRAKIPNALVASNPGTICAKEYVASQAFDVICVFENGESYDSFQMPDWGVPAGRTWFAAFPYGEPAAEIAQRYLQQAASKGISYIYVTHDMLPNPWDELASYWDREVAIVSEINAVGPQRAPKK